MRKKKLVSQGSETSTYMLVKLVKRREDREKKKKERRKKQCRCSHLRAILMCTFFWVRKMRTKMRKKKKKKKKGVSFIFFDWGNSNEKRQTKLELDRKTHLVEPPKLMTAPSPTFTGSKEGMRRSLKNVPLVDPKSYKKMVSLGPCTKAAWTRLIDKWFNRISLLK